MQDEFEKLIGQRVEAYDYKIIEFVYMWHPVINNVTGKQQIADLYKLGGMAVIKGMLDIAKQAEKIQRRIEDLKDELNALRGELLYLRDGDWKVELESEPKESQAEEA